ncbi:MAG: hemolysin family protein [Fimbriimonadaceae bacterium]
METDSSTTVLLSVILLLGHVFFVAAEYALVGARRSKIEALARRGSKTAQRVLKAIDDRSTYIAGTQIGITMIGIALGALTEPFLSGLLLSAFAALPQTLASALAIILVTYPIVVIGELTPKYVTLRYAERVALAVIIPLSVIMPLLKPMTWLFQKTTWMVLRPFGINGDEQERQGMSREEFAVLVRTGHDEGEFDESQAQFLTKTLRFDMLDAEDVMIHRLDVLWIPLHTPKHEIPMRAAEIRHSRIPVCDADIDDVVGIVYVSDILARWDDPDFSIARIMREPEFVPETLTLDKIIAHMRETKTQIVIVRDEYGGTSGLVTLEDLVEEIFGDMEDRLESERAPIEQTSEVRVLARSDVRYDELLDFLRLEPVGDDVSTQTLASLVVDHFGRVPKIGDSVRLPIGTLKVENMARQRITRLSVHLDPTVLQPVEARE